MGVFKNRYSQTRSGWKILIALGISFGLQIVTGIVGGILVGIEAISQTGFENIERLTEKIKEMINSPVIGTLLQIVSISAGIVGVFIVVRFVDRKRLKGIGFKLNGKSFKDMAVGLVMGACSMMVIFFVLLLSGSISMTNSFTNPNLTLYTLTGFILFVFVGFEEELFSRGYCMKSLEQTGSKWVPTVVSAVIFSLLHSGNENLKLLGLFNIFLVGILFSIMVIKTGNIMMAIGYHITWNYFQGNIFGFPVSGTEPHGIYNIKILKDNFLTGGGFGPEAGVMTTLVVIAGVLVVWKIGKKDEKEKSFSAEA